MYTVTTKTARERIQGKKKTTEITSVKKQQQPPTFLPTLSFKNACTSASLRSCESLDWNRRPTKRNASWWTPLQATCGGKERSASSRTLTLNCTRLRRTHTRSCPENTHIISCAARTHTLAARTHKAAAGLCAGERRALARARKRTGMDEEATGREHGLPLVTAEGLVWSHFVMG